MTDQFSPPDSREFHFTGDLPPVDSEAAPNPAFHMPEPLDQPEQTPASPDFHWEDEPDRFLWDEDIQENDQVISPSPEQPVPMDKTIAVPEIPAQPQPADEVVPPLPEEEAPAPALFDASMPATVVPRPEYRKKSTGRKVLHVFAVIGKYLAALILAIAIGGVGLVGYLTVTEYNPAHAEVAQRGAVNIDTLFSGQTFRIVTFNTGYGGLDEEADFFMDGGKTVTPDSEERIRRNMLGIETILKDCDADFYFLQEVDTDSKRTYGLNQWLQYEYDLENYESRFAQNFSCDYVPYPLKDNIGKVHSGVATYSRYDISSATRYSLPCPFSWPSRVANLKRCMLVTRIPIDGQEEQELVLVNFHLEAYDDGEGKEAQTRQLLDFIQAEYAKGNYVIAGGDFNQVLPGTLNTYPIKDSSQWTPNTLESLPEGWKYAYDSFIPTCRLLNQPLNPASSLTQYYIIDGFIVSPNLTVERVQTLDEGFVYADHNPVVLDISLNLPAEE